MRPTTYTTVATATAATSINAKTVSMVRSLRRIVISPPMVHIRRQKHNLAMQFRARSITFKPIVIHDKHLIRLLLGAKTDWLTTLHMSLVNRQQLSYKEESSSSLPSSYPLPPHACRF